MRVPMVGGEWGWARWVGMASGGDSGGGGM